MNSRYPSFVSESINVASQLEDVDNRSKNHRQVSSYMDSDYGKFTIPLTITYSSVRVEIQIHTPFRLKGDAAA